MIAGIITSGDIAIFIIVLTMFEVAGLILLRRRKAKGPRLRDFLPNLLAGDFLLLAWYADMANVVWHFIALALLAALLCHLTDLALRWRNSP